MALDILSLLASGGMFSILIILAVSIIIILTIIELVLKRQINLKNQQKEDPYKRRIKTLKLLEGDYDKKLRNINILTREFFQETFNVNKNLSYYQILDIFKEKNKFKIVEFCQKMLHTLYSGKKLSNIELNSIIKRLDIIISEEREIFPRKIEKKQIKIKHDITIIKLIEKIRRYIHKTGIEWEKKRIRKEEKLIREKEKKRREKEDEEKEAKRKELEKKEKEDEEKEKGRKERENYYIIKTKNLKESRDIYSKKLNDINILAREFFQETFNIDKQQSYLVILEKFKGKNKPKIIEFSQKMPGALYSGDRLDKKKLDNLMNLLDGIIHDEKRILIKRRLDRQAITIRQSSSDIIKGMEKFIKEGQREKEKMIIGVKKGIHNIERDWKKRKTKMKQIFNLFSRQLLKIKKEKLDNLMNLLDGIIHNEKRILIKRRLDRQAITIRQSSSDIIKGMEKFIKEGQREKEKMIIGVKKGIHNIERDWKKRKTKIESERRIEELLEKKEREKMGQIGIIAPKMEKIIHRKIRLTKKPIKYKSISSMDDLERIKDKIEHVKKVVGTKH